MYLLDSVDDFVIEQTMGLINQISDVNQAVFFLHTATTVHFWHFNAENYQIWPLIALDIFVEGKATLHIALKLLKLLVLLLD